MILALYFHFLLELLPLSSSLFLEIFSKEQKNIVFFHVMSGVNILSALYITNLKSFSSDLKNYRQYVLYLTSLSFWFVFFKIIPSLSFSLYERILLNAISGILMLFSSENTNREADWKNFLMMGFIVSFSYYLKISRLGCLITYLSFCKVNNFFLLAVKIANIANVAYLPMIFARTTTNQFSLILLLSLLSIPSTVFALSFLRRRVKEVLLFCTVIRIIYLPIYLIVFFYFRKDIPLA